MDNFLAFVFANLPMYISVFEGLMTLIVLWSIEKDLQILISKRSHLEDEVKKISITLMGSMNDLRKILKPGVGRNRNQK